MTDGEAKDRSETLSLLYSYFLHGRFGRLGGRPAAHPTVTEIVEVSEAVSASDLKSLLSATDWRRRLVGGWLVALRRDASFVELVGQRLLAKERPFASQGYCAALGLIGGARSEEFLSEYLHQNLPPSDNMCDQDWAIGALALARKGALDEFMGDDLWSGGSRQLDPWRAIREFASSVEYLRQQGLIAA